MAKVLSVIGLLVLCCLVLTEGRWHDLRGPRRHEQAFDDDDSPRHLDEQLRHRRHRPAEYDDSSLEDDEAVVDEGPRAPPRLEFDGDPDRHGEPRGEAAAAQRAPRRRSAHPRKHHRRHRARHHKRTTLGDLNEGLRLEYDDEGDDDDEAGAELSRDKRHQRRKNWTDEDWRAFESSRRPELYDHDIHVFELEVREAQNSSLCNYTVVPIPDPGGRVPRVLEHVKCNYVGNRCRERGSYCCVQTYRNVEVTYPGNRNDTVKVYSGCVCALQIYGTLKPYNPKLPLDD